MTLYCIDKLNDVHFLWLQTKCFICGIGNDYFDTVPHGFETHTLQEHNLANYLWVKTKQKTFQMKYQSTCVQVEIRETNGCVLCFITWTQTRTWTGKVGVVVHWRRLLQYWLLSFRLFSGRPERCWAFVHTTGHVQNQSAQLWTAHVHVYVYVSGPHSDKITIVTL